MTTATSTATKRFSGDLANSANLAQGNERKGGSSRWTSGTQSWGWPNFQTGNNLGGGKVQSICRQEESNIIQWFKSTAGLHQNRPGTPTHFAKVATGLGGLCAENLCTDSLVGQQVHRSIDVSIKYWQKNLYCDGCWHFKLWRRTRLNSSTPLSCSWQVLSRKPQKELNFVLTTISFVSICIVCDSMFYQSTFRKFLLSLFLPPV